MGLECTAEMEVGSVVAFQWELDKCEGTESDILWGELMRVNWPNCYCTDPVQTRLVEWSHFLAAIL